MSSKSLHRSLFATMVPQQVMELLDRTASSRSAELPALIDVRSEGEFAVGSIPGFVNLPILTDGERHQVGLCYKLKGQVAAIALGHELVASLRRTRVDSWLDQINRSGSHGAIVSCWRGGLRSQIAAEWLREANANVATVDGGYKALRAFLTRQIAQPRPMLILAGLTGSGKTQLLHSLPSVPQVDIEALAVHRGSAFGGFADRPQPTTANFENGLGLALWRRLEQKVLIEDESQAIGAVFLPTAFRDMMSKSPVVFLEASLNTRSANIFQEYVALPLAGGRTGQDVLGDLAAALIKIKSKLGGGLHADLQAMLDAAFMRDEKPQLSHHVSWIEALLTHYYDKRYWYSFGRQPRDVVFKGDFKQCQTWLLNQYA